MAYALFALASPWGAVAFVVPAVMLYLLFRVTGVPATEAQALRSRGDDYRRYQSTTSVFAPWFPRTAMTLVDIAWGALSCGAASWVAARFARV